MNLDFIEDDDKNDDVKTAGDEDVKFKMPDISYNSWHNDNVEKKE